MKNGWSRSPGSLLPYELTCSVAQSYTPVMQSASSQWAWQPHGIRAVVEMNKE